MLTRTTEGLRTDCWTTWHLLSLDGRRNNVCVGTGGRRRPMTLCLPLSVGVLNEVFLAPVGLSP